MNKRGQSALEYLMTYGWALIVIAIVIGILYVVFTGATSAVNCSVAGNLVVTDYSVTSGDVELVVQNGEGREITSLSANGAGDFNGITFTPDPTTVTSGATSTISGDAGPGTGDFTGTTTLTYNVTNGLTGKQATITCSGRI